MSDVYDDRFYADRSGAAASAAAVVPFLAELLRPASVLDVGCGTGEWLSAFGSHGVEDVLGVDGAWVERARLAIDPGRFREHDLATPLDLGRTFDLALCLEVAEHLPQSAAPTLVESLVRASPVVLFGAAIPDQRGEGHVNEQWQSWWAAHFREQGYRAVDALRARFWDDDRVEWWYAQNTLLYVAADELDRRPPLVRLAAESTGTPISIVHPKGYLSFRRGGLLDALRRRL